MLIISGRNRVQDDSRIRKRGTQNSPLGRLLGAVLLIFLIVVSAAAAAPRRIPITAKRFAFEPADITVKVGEPVDLVLTSEDVSHGLRVRELNINIKASQGKPGEVKFTPQKPGTFVGHCSVFCGSGHGKMMLTIHVVA